MKKILVASAILLTGMAAQASQITVNSNMYLASGPVTSQYFQNLKKLNAEVSKVSNATLGQFTFAGASVSTSDATVRYSFHRIELNDDVQVCWSNVQFTAQETAQGPVVSDVRASLSCSEHND